MINGQLFLTLTGQKQLEIIIRRNIIHVIPGTKNEVKTVCTPLEFFSLFITPAILNKVVIYTNEMIDIKNKNIKIKQLLFLPQSFKKLVL